MHLVSVIELISDKAEKTLAELGFSHGLDATVIEELEG